VALFCGCPKTSHRQAPNRTCAAAAVYRWPQFVGGAVVDVVPNIVVDNPNFAFRSSSDSFAFQDSARNRFLTDADDSSWRLVVVAAPCTSVDCYCCCILADTVP